MLAFTPFSVDFNLRTRSLPRNPEDSQNRNADRLISSLPLLSQNAAWLWMCVWPPPTKQQLEETLRKQPLIVNPHTTDNKFQIFEVRASFTVSSSGQQLGHRTLLPLEHCSMQQISHPAGKANKCRDRALSLGFELPRLTVTRAQTQGQTPPYLTMMMMTTTISPLAPVNHICQLYSWPTGGRVLAS